MRLRAVLVAFAIVAGLSAPAVAKGDRRLGAAWAKKRGAATTTTPPVVRPKSRVQSAGTACRSQAKG